MINNEEFDISQKHRNENADARFWGIYGGLHGGAPTVAVIGMGDGSCFVIWCESTRTYTDERWTEWPRLRNLHTVALARLDNQYHLLGVLEELGGSQLLFSWQRPVQFA